MASSMDLMQRCLRMEPRGVEKRILLGEGMHCCINISGNPENPGLIYLTTQELFERCATMTEKKIDITLSFLEIYNETIRDLLIPVEESKPLQLREDANQRISVPGLRTASPATVATLIKHTNYRSTK